MTDWQRLTDACGSAEHVPALLDRFEADPSGVWSEVIDHLCPQLDQAFPASYAALPRLAEIATACRPDDLTSVLLAAGAIAACAPALSEPYSPLTVHSTSIGVLQGLTDRHLSQVVGAEEYVNLLQTLLSFEGVEIWDRCLDGLQSGEYEVECGHCGVNVFVVIGRDDSFCCSDDYALGEVEKSPLRPMRPQDMGRRAAAEVVHACDGGRAGELGTRPSVPVRTCRLPGLQDRFLSGGAGGGRLDPMTDLATDRRGLAAQNGN
ncbi:hypothetical protein ACIBCO_41390 [Streptomyces violascens]|uniref:hypothetical protein n=1 Tax=Streptomyces violascens TaxID=67381 RepID=UPI0037BC7213